VKYGYQEDFFMPGMLPSRASSRKQMRQRLKSRIKPRGRPHLKHRRTVREENFGTRFALIIIDFFAIGIPVAPRRVAWKPLHCGLAAHTYGSFIAWPCSSSNLWLKNKAPYEARKIYAKWWAKSNALFLRLTSHAYW